MMKPAVLAASLVSALASLSSIAQADETTTAGTLVVVTPNAPIVVTTGGAGGAGGAGPSTVAPTVAAPSGAPQNEAWDNVSHVNGVPVKVGERGDYLYAFRKTNVAANPFGLMFGYLDASVSHALSSNVAVSGSLTLYSGDYDSSMGGAISAPIYFKRTFTGPYLEPGLTFRASSSQEIAYGAGGAYPSGGAAHDDSAVNAEILFGWQWMFDSGLNVAAAIGVERRLNPQTDAYGYGTSSDAGANGYFRVGYAF